MSSSIARMRFRSNRMRLSPIPIEKTWKKTSMKYPVLDNDFYDFYRLISKYLDFYRFGISDEKILNPWHLKNFFAGKVINLPLTYFCNDLQLRACIKK